MRSQIEILKEQLQEKLKKQWQEILNEQLQEKLKSESKSDSQTYNVYPFKSGPAKRQDGESYQAYKDRMKREKQKLRTRLRGSPMFIPNFIGRDINGKRVVLPATYRRDFDVKSPTMEVDQ